MNAKLSIVCAFLFLVASANVSAAVTPTFDFIFTGQCDDCAFNGLPGDPGFDPIGDGLFETVSGTLRLTDVTLNGLGQIEVSSNNFHSFSYNGSSLINAFMFDDAFTITGRLSPQGAVLAGHDLLLESSDGPNETFFFPNFCTALGEQVLDIDCQGVGLVSFDLGADGEWAIGSSQPFDFGGGGELVSAALIPLPLSAVFLLSGMLGLLGLRRQG